MKTLISNKQRKYLKAFILGISLMAELLIVRFYTGNFTSLICLLACIFFGTLVLMFFFNSWLNFKYIFASVVKQFGAGYLSLVSILYFLANFSWLLDSVREFSEKMEQASLANLLVYSVFVFLPFMIFTFFEKPTPSKVLLSDRKILFTGISLLAYNPSKGEVVVEKLDECLAELNRVSSYEDWSFLIKWKPIFDSLSKFPHLRKIVILSTPTVQKQQEYILKDKRYSHLTISSLIKKYFPLLDVQIEILEDANNVQSNLNLMSRIINVYFPNVNDKELIFSVTSGTSALSAAMAMVAVKGKRGLAYKRQDNNVLQIDETNVFNLQELWEEIMELYDVKDKEE